jgi:glycosyltransferase involved in cell wall biosynthesis
MKQKPLRKFLFWQVAGKRMLQNAAAVHYTAADEKSRTEESLGLNHGRVIPLGVDSALAQPANGHKASNKLPQLAGHPYVLVLSRLHPKKAIDVLIEAFAALRLDEKFQEWKLVIAGEGPDDYVKELRERVSAHHANHSVIFAGWLEGEDKKCWLQAASLLALPSYQENFGVCAMEALSAGVPVMVSPHVNLAKEIESAQAGWITTVDKLAIRAALAEALSSKEERARRGEAGRVLSAEFSNEIAASRLIDMYRSVSAAN